MNLISKMQEYSDLITGIGVSDEEIQKTESVLKLQFSDEYREYLTVFGIAAVNGHELTGISGSQRTNVVNVTIEQRDKLPNIPADLYVIEEANIDGVVIWQSSAGEIFQTKPNVLPTKIFDSLCEYIKL